MSTGPSIKDDCTKSQKIDPLPLVRSDTSEISKNSKLFSYKSADVHMKNLPCPHNIRTGQSPSPLTTDVLWTAPNWKVSPERWRRLRFERSFQVLFLLFQTGICSNLNSLWQDYLNPLRTAINLSRMHFRDELQKQSKPERIGRLAHNTF